MDPPRQSIYHHQREQNEPPPSDSEQNPTTTPVPRTEATSQEPLLLLSQEDLGIFERARRWAERLIREQAEEYDELLDPLRQDELKLRDLEFEAGLSPSEKTRCQAVIESHLREYHQQFRDWADFDPKSIARNTVPLSDEDFIRWQKEYGIGIALSGFVLEYEEHGSRVMFITKETLEDEAGKILVRHEAGHALRSPDCPIGLNEGGAEYYALQIPDSRELSVRLRTLLPEPSTAQKKGRVTAKLEEVILDIYIGTHYDWPTRIYGNLVEAVGIEAMNELYFKGSRQLIDTTVPEAVRLFVDMTIASLNLTHKHGGPIASAAIAEAYADSLIAKKLAKQAATPKK